MRVNSFAQCMSFRSSDQLGYEGAYSDLFQNTYNASFHSLSFSTLFTREYGALCVLSKDYDSIIFTRSLG